MKPKIPNQKKAYDALNLRLIKYMSQVQSIYDRIANQIATSIDGVSYDGSAEFFFADYPELKQTIKGIMTSYAAQMNNLIYSRTTNEWKESNIMQDLLARKVLRAYGFEKGGDKYNRYFQPNTDALKVFQQRVDRGMNLSQKLWVQSQALKKEIEHTISIAIEKGQSAVVLSKRISKYLSDFSSMKADYAEKYGKAVSCHDCQYASVRLARTEINMAYRKAEQTRWQQFDFILGYEVKLSKRHPAPDICDDLIGIYPKDFIFLGWHPNCMCYVVPVVMSDDEYYGSPSVHKAAMITRTPKNFNEWVRNNRTRIGNAKTLPYFLKDNRKYWHLSVEEAAKYRHADRDEKAIKRAAKNRSLLTTETDVNNDDIAYLRRKAKAYNIDISSFDKFIASHQFKESLGMITDSERSLLSDMYHRYEDRVYQAFKSFEGYKKSYLSKFDYSYDFGDWKDNVRKKFTDIAPTQFEQVSKIRSKVKATYDEARKELHELRSIPLRPKKIIGDFDDFDLEIALDDKEAVMAGKKLLQNLYGQNLDYNTTWRQIASAIQSEGWGKGYDVFIEEYRKKGLKEVMKSATHLNELCTADLSVIPKHWTPRFNDYIKTIESARIDTRGYNMVYREIEGAYNIYKLASDKELVKYGLNKLSFNTPYRIVEGFRQIGLSPTKWLGKKEFYDSFDKFVPCISLGGREAYFWGKYNHVRIDFDGLKERLVKSEYYRKSLQYHEFGHAKAALQGNWEENADFKNLYKKFFDDYNNPENRYVNEEGVEQWKIVDKLWKELNLIRNKTYDVREQFGKISDTLQAFDKDHNWIHGLSGHEVNYFASSLQNCLSEIIAHLSESYWTNNRYFKKVLPRFYNEAIALYEKYYKLNKPKKR